MSGAAGRLLLLLPFAALVMERQAAAGLDRAETRAAAAAAQAVSTQLAGPPGATLRAGDAAAAGSALVRLLGDRAARVGVRLTATPRAQDGLAQAEVEARGGEAAVRAFSLATEGTRPLVRWTRWRLAPEGDGLTLRAVAAAPWRP